VRIRFQEERVPLPFRVPRPLDAATSGSDRGLLVASEDEGEDGVRVRRFDPRTETASFLAQLPARAPRRIVSSVEHVVLLTDDGVFLLEPHGAAAPVHLPLRDIGGSSALFVSSDGRRAVVSSAFHDRCTVLALDSKKPVAVVRFSALDVITGTADELSLVSTRTSRRVSLDAAGRIVRHATSMPAPALDPTRIGASVIGIATAGRSTAATDLPRLPYTGLMGLEPTNRVVAFDDDLARVFVGPPLAPRGSRRGPPVFFGAPLGVTEDGHVVLHAKTDFGPEEIVLLERTTLRAVARHILFTEPIGPCLAGPRTVAGLVATRDDGTMVCVIRWGAEVTQTRRSDRSSR
jgi:hypothetical protein